MTRLLVAATLIILSFSGTALAAQTGEALLPLSRDTAPGLGTALVGLVVSCLSARYIPTATGQHLSLAACPIPAFLQSCRRGFCMSIPAR